MCGYLREHKQMTLPGDEYTLPDGTYISIWPDTQRNLTVASVITYTNGVISGVEDYDASTGRRLRQTIQTNSH